MTPVSSQVKLELLKMRKIVSVLLFAVLFASCSTVRQVQSGDLLFVGLPMDYAVEKDTTMSGAIVSATGAKDAVNYIHVAILEVDYADKVWIVDATLKHGVDRHPVDTFLSDFRLSNGSLPQLDVKRLKNNKRAFEFVENAKQYCGQPYDLYFLKDNDAKYCSELVYDAYVTSKGKHIFKSKPMNFKGPDGSFPPYWVRLFERIGQTIPQGQPGTNPNDMSKSKALRKGFPLEIGAK